MIISVSGYRKKDIDLIISSLIALDQRDHPDKVIFSRYALLSNLERVENGTLVLDLDDRFVGGKRIGGGILHKFRILCVQARPRGLVIFIPLLYGEGNSFKEKLRREVQRWVTVRIDQCIPPRIACAKCGKFHRKNTVVIEEHKEFFGKEVDLEQCSAVRFLMYREGALGFTAYSIKKKGAPGTT